MNDLNLVNKLNVKKSWFLETEIAKIKQTNNFQFGPLNMTPCEFGPFTDNNKNIDDAIISLCALTDAATLENQEQNIALVKAVDDAVSAYFNSKK